MTFWDPDAETNLVSNKKPERKLHESEARSAFGSTDLPGTGGSSPTSSSGASTPASSAAGGSVASRQPSTQPGGVSPAATTGDAPAKSVADAGDKSDKLRAATERLHQHQAAVPKLPVPELKETLDLYLKSLEGLVSAESWSRTKQYVDDFLAPGGGGNNSGNASRRSGRSGTASSGDEPSIGETLQRMLVEHAATTASPSWLEPFWDDMYLTGRDPIPINVNYFFGFAASPKIHPNKYSAAQSELNLQDDEENELLHTQILGGNTAAATAAASAAPAAKPAAVYDETQINRAACLLHGAGGIFNDIRTGNFAVDMERKAPLCMSQYRRVFCASRMPGEERDHIITYMPGLDLAADELASSTTRYQRLASVPRHVVVIVRNRYFSVDILGDAACGFAVYGVEDIARRLAFCVAAAGNTAATCGAPVGVFTTMQRTDWFHAREQLVELGNEDALERIQSALLVVALDTYTCADMQETARILLHGPGTNRWFDRHTLIVSRSGDAGINFEHAVGDGAVTLRIADEMFRREKKLHDAGKALSRGRVRELLQEAVAAAAVASPSASQQQQQQQAVGKTLGIEELRWKLDGALDTLLRNAYAAYVELIQSTETTTLDFHRYGGDYIKKSGNSPDAFVQLAFQLTHHRLFNKPAATYEAASTRVFSHGRTETVRSCTRAATDFCILSGEPIFTHRVNSQIPAQLALLKNATAAHVDYMKRAKEGRGVDRHLFGLRHMAAKLGLSAASGTMPALFTDDNLKQSAHWAMSTSHCGSSALSLFGFGPVVSDGVGLGYMIKNDNISVCITSKYTHRFNSSKVFATMLEASLLHMRAIVDADWESRAQARPRAMEFSHPTLVKDMEYDPRCGFRYAQPGAQRSLYGPAGSGLVGSGSFPSMNTY